MLVLSRKESQRVRLGDEIVLTIVRVSGDRVRLGIEAPANVVILREELDHDDTQHAGIQKLNDIPEIEDQRKAA